MQIKFRIGTTVLAIIKGHIGELEIDSIVVNRDHIIYKCIAPKDRLKTFDLNQEDCFKDVESLVANLTRNYILFYGKN